MERILYEALGFRRRSHKTAGIASAYREMREHIMSVSKVFRAKTIEDAVSLLQEHGEKAQVLAGGTDLLVQIREKHNRGEIMIDVTDVKEISSIEFSPEFVTIGAMVRFTDVVESDELKSRLPGLWDACKSVGSPQIRNLGTLGGNLANGSPAADSAPPLMALSAVVTAVSTRGERSIPLNEFYLGKGKTALELDELLTAIKIPVSKEKPVFIEFEKLGLRNALAISRISAAVCLELDGEKNITACGIGSGSLGLNPMKETELEAWMMGKTFNEDLIKEAADKFSDIVENRLSGRSSMPYKREAVQGVLKPALRRILASV